MFCLEIVCFYDTNCVNIYKYAHSRYIKKTELVNFLGFAQLDASFLRKTTDTITARERKIRFEAAKFAQCNHQLPYAFKRI